MGKQFVLISLSILLSLSILAPSVVLLMDVKIEMIGLNEMDEESQKKGEQEVLETEAFVPFHQKTVPVVVLSERNNAIFYLENSSTHYLKVVLPPPEQGA